MVLRVLIYFIILFLGYLLGNKDKIRHELYHKLNTIQSICLFFLLFIMGTRVGLDDSVISSFPVIGFKATIISLVTIIVTILITRVISKFVFNKKGEENIES